MRAQSSTYQGNDGEDIIQMTEFHPRTASTIYYYSAHDSKNEEDELHTKVASNNDNEDAEGNKIQTNRQELRVTYAVIRTQMFVATSLEVNSYIIDK